MKNLFSLLSMAVIAFGFSACSSDELAIQGGEQNGIDAEYVPSEVAIQLQGGALWKGTRAAVMSDNTLPSDMGVWCVAKGVQDINKEPANIAWFDNSLSHRTCCLMENVQSSLANNVVSWSGVYFYPVTQFYNYEFYACYPYNTSLTKTTTSVRANYVIDGRTDLMWGRATSDDPYAYSARYFRQHGGQTFDNMPELVMEHMLARLTFTIEPGAAVEGAPVPDYSLAAKMKVASIELCDVPTKLGLVVADYNRLNMDINSRLTITPGSETDTLSLCEETGTPFAAVQVPSTPEERIQVGESIMLFPEKSYMLRIVLIDENNLQHVSESPLKISNGGFERGKSYKIAITVHGPQVVDSKARIVPWEEIDGPVVDL